MIEIEPIEDEDNFAFSTIVTYPRKTQISHGMYTNKVDMMNMITMIKTNIVHKDKISLKTGIPLIIPELKITIKPKIGSYYIFEPYILHNVPEVTDDKARYNMIINMREK